MLWGHVASCEQLLTDETGRAIRDLQVGAPTMDATTSPRVPYAARPCTRLRSGCLPSSASYRATHRLPRWTWTARKDEVVTRSRLTRRQACTARPGGHRTFATRSALAAPSAGRSLSPIVAHTFDVVTTCHPIGVAGRLAGDHGGALAGSRVRRAVVRRGATILRGRPSSVKGPLRSGCAGP
jgi:hypothetical protein